MPNSMSIAAHNKHSINTVTLPNQCGVIVVKVSASTARAAPATMHQNVIRSITSLAGVFSSLAALPDWKATVANPNPTPPIDKIRTNQDRTTTILASLNYQELSYPSTLIIAQISKKIKTKHKHIDNFANL